MNKLFLCLGVAAATAVVALLVWAQSGPLDWAVALASAAFIVWWLTGYDALYWIIRGLIWLRAALHLAGRVIAEAARTWRRALPDTVSEMRREMAE